MQLTLLAVAQVRSVFGGLSALIVNEVAICLCLYKIFFIDLRRHTLSAIQERIPCQPLLICQRLRTAISAVEIFWVDVSGLHMPLPLPAFLHFILDPLLLLDTVQ